MFVDRYESTPAEPDVLEPVIKPDLSEGPHLSYAVQWFIFSLAVAVGWGRSGFGPGAAMAGRYATLAAPIGCAAYLAWCRLPWPGTARAVQTACVLAALSLYGDNLAAGRDAAFRQRAGLQALTREVRLGLSLAEVAGRHAGDVYPNPLVLHERLILLRNLRLGPFAP